MKKRLAHGLKLMLVLSLVMSLLSACGAAPSVQENYPLESVSGSGQSTSYVYRAADRTVPEVAQELSDQRKPDQISAESTERMFLVYSDQYYHLQQDPKKPEDTLVEVDSKEYVRQNYSSSFLQGYLTATLIGNLFDTFGGAGLATIGVIRNVIRINRAPDHTGHLRAMIKNWPRHSPLNAKVQLRDVEVTRIQALVLAAVCLTERRIRAEAASIVTKAAAAWVVCLILRKIL